MNLDKIYDQILTRKESRESSTYTLSGNLDSTIGFLHTYPYTDKFVCEPDTNVRIA